MESTSSRRTASSLSLQPDYGTSDAALPRVGDTEMGTSHDVLIGLRDIQTWDRVGTMLTKTLHLKSREVHYAIMKAGGGVGYYVGVRESMGKIKNRSLYLNADGSLTGDLFSATTYDNIHEAMKPLIKHASAVIRLHGLPDTIEEDPESASLWRRWFHLANTE